MSDKRIFVLSHEYARRNAISHIARAPDGYKVTVQEPSRTLDQNAAQWPILEAFSKQLRWPVNGRMELLTPEEWKDLLTAAFQGEKVRLASGLNGGVVMLGLRTSRFSKQRFSDWLEFLNATAVDRGVDLQSRVSDADRRVPGTIADTEQDAEDNALLRSGRP